MYAGLSFGFFLKLQEERKKEKKLEILNRRALETNAAGTSLGQHRPLLDTRQKSEGGGGDTTLVPAAGAGAHHWEMKSTKSGEKPSEGSCGDGSSTTCLSCWNGVPHDS